MILALALPLALLADPPPDDCAYPAEHYLGVWRAEVPEEVADGDASLIEFSSEGRSQTWREWLHFRPFDSGNWQTTKDCGTIVLRSATSEIVVARIKAIGNDRVLVESSGQVYERYQSSEGANSE